MNDAAAPRWLIWPTAGAVVLALAAFLLWGLGGAGTWSWRCTASPRRIATSGIAAVTYGMSQAMGPMVYGENDGEVFVGRSITTHKNLSDATMQKVDQEIRRIIDEQYALARRILDENRDKDDPVGERVAGVDLAQLWLGGAADVGGGRATVPGPGGRFSDQYDRVGQMTSQPRETR